MSKTKVILGIDTSNYTTSLALVTLETCEVIKNHKQLLSVSMGERGLRQSEAVFSHVKNITAFMEESEELLSEYSIVAVGVSEKPRNIEGSYMPCFLVGVLVAESVAKSLNVPLFRFSHQCGHVMAALYSSGRTDLLSGNPFVAFHVSGGTTEMLLVKQKDYAFECELIGEHSALKKYTKDIRRKLWNIYLF